jgi:hypothetical protein
MAAIGRKGGKARRRVTPAEAEAELPRMDSPEAIRTRLETVSVWAAAGLVSSGVASALVRACEIGLKNLDAMLDRDRVKVLEGRVKELTAALDAAKRAPGVRGVG